MRDRRLGDRLFAWTLELIVLGLVVAALAGLPANPWSPWRIGAVSETTDQLRLHASQARLERQGISEFTLPIPSPIGTFGPGGATGFCGIL